MAEARIADEAVAATSVKLKCRWLAMTLAAAPGSAPMVLCVAGSAWTGARKCSDALTLPFLEDDVDRVYMARAAHTDGREVVEAIEQGAVRVSVTTTNVRATSAEPCSSSTRGCSMGTG